MTDKRMENKVVIVTGGANGIGAATAKLLASQGAKVAIFDVKEAANVVKEIQTNDSEALYISCDISDETAVKAAFAKVVEHYGKLDGLFNNAAIPGTTKMLDAVTETEFMEVININLKGAFFCMREAIPYFRQNGKGAIVNTSSVSGLCGTGGMYPYHASKGAIGIITKNAAVDYVKDNIRVNAVCPACVDTAMVDAYGEIPSADVDQWIKDNQPMPRKAAPLEIANAVLFLLSDEASFITGVDLPVDGGFMAR